MLTECFVKLMQTVLLTTTMFKSSRMDDEYDNVEAPKISKTKNFSIFLNQTIEWHGKATTITSNTSTYVEKQENVILRVLSVTPNGVEKDFDFLGVNLYYQQQALIGEIEFEGTFDPTSGKIVFTEQKVIKGISSVPLPAVYEAHINDSGSFITGSLLKNALCARNFKLQERDRE